MKSLSQHIQESFNEDNETIDANDKEVVAEYVSTETEKEKPSENTFLGSVIKPNTNSGINRTS